MSGQNWVSNRQNIVAVVVAVIVIVVVVVIVLSADDPDTQHNHSQEHQPSPKAGVETRNVSKVDDLDDEGYEDAPRPVQQVYLPSIFQLQCQQVEVTLKNKRNGKESNFESVKSTLVGELDTTDHETKEEDKSADDILGCCESCYVLFSVKYSQY